MEHLITTDTSENSLSIYNPETGTKLLSIRSPPINSLTFIKSEGFLVSELSKPFLHYYQCGSLQTSKRILCPGKVGPLQASPDGLFLLAGVEEKIIIWSISNGRILKILTNHYKAVNVLKFTDDSNYFLSGGDDGIVYTFDFIGIVSSKANNTSNNTNSSSSSTKYTWSDHNFPVKDIHVGLGGYKSSVFTTGLDRTVKVYSLVDGRLLISVSFPLPLTKLVVDKAEYSFYAGTSSGIIYRMKLHAKFRSIVNHSGDESIDYLYKKHSTAISGLGLRADGLILASSDVGGHVYIWDTNSCLIVKSILTGNVNVQITNCCFWFGDLEELKSSKPTVYFPEVGKLVEKEGGDEDLLEVVHVLNTVEDENGVVNYSNNDNGSIAQNEILELKERLAKAEDVNKKLYQFYLENILNATKK